MSNEAPQEPRPPGFPSNYPRLSPRSPRLLRPPGIYLDIVGEAWEVFRERWGTWLLMLLPLAICTGFTLSILVAAEMVLSVQEAARTISNQTAAAIRVLVGLVPYALITWLYAGSAAAMVRHLNGEEVDWTDGFAGIQRFSGFLFISAIISVWGWLPNLIEAGPAMTFVFSILYLAITLATMPALALTPIRMVLDNTSTWRLFVDTLSRTYGYWFKYLILSIGLTMLVVVGMCALVVGAYVVMCLYIIVMALHYRFIFQEEPAESPGQVIGEFRV